MGNPKLENWYISSKGLDLKPYSMLEEQIYVLIGDVYGHPTERHYDGKTVCTSEVIDLDLKNGVAKTKNTIYELGKPSESWLKWLKDNYHEKISEFTNK